MANETVNQETPIQEVEQPKTFTQEEVNGIIADRLARDRQKYADYESLKEKASKFDEMEEANKSELQKATERADSLAKELDALKKANEIQSIRQKIANETGIPVELLNYDTEEECRQHAEAIKAYAGNQPSYPVVKDGGEAHGGAKLSTKQQFAEWFNSQTS